MTALGLILIVVGFGLGILVGAVLRASGHDKASENVAQVAATIAISGAALLVLEALIRVI